MCINVSLQYTSNNPIKYAPGSEAVIVGLATVLFGSKDKVPKSL
ncbi:MAG: Uncharacterised protein [Crocinitomicaceae bacterium]|nr:MAG: Uncharacterised protein [Crocinitomicaceae bacterium]